ncbi:ash family protein [Escherichia coli]|nr:ash family protein [Escherichia coli]EJN3621439.1 ash family protein [Escherichia coli]EJN3775048.1 ash family protein [Escherichia coli]EJN3877281.1 ash family protein [Escherichia coli]EJN4034732.1 ash family protein [Escherichia coli]
MHTQKNRLPAFAWSGYSFPAPHKTGVGISTLETSKAHNRASGFFMRTVSSHLFRTRIMVGRTGPTSVGPGSLLAGCGNPVRLTTPSFPPPDGEFSQLTSKEATPWQTASNSAPALSIFTSGLKSTADLPAPLASRSSCNQTYCIALTAAFLRIIARQSSAIWPKTWQSCRTSSTSNTTTNQHPEAIPHPCAGGFRTSVTGGSHEER